MNIPAFKIRLADISDADAYDAYVTALFAENLEMFPDRGPIPSADQIQAMYKRYNGEHAALFFAESQGRLIGRVSVGRIEQPNREHVATLGITVGCGFRGMGVGRALMARAHSWVSEKPWLERIELEAVSENLPAIRLYESFGFETEGVRRKAMKKNGRYFDLLLMARMPNSKFDADAQARR
jgi:putative acetyltransferase